MLGHLNWLEYHLLLLLEISMNQNQVHQVEKYSEFRSVLFLQDNRQKIVQALGKDDAAWKHLSLKYFNAVYFFFNLRANVMQKCL